MAIRWWGDKREWGVICGTKEAEIISVKILDGRGKESGKFEVNDKIIVKAYFRVNDEVREPHFGVAIFRDDNVYCYGPNTQFDGYKIDKLAKGEGWFSIEYEEMALMPGKYKLSVGIWDKKELLPYSFHITRYNFMIKGCNKNKQLLFLPCSFDNGKSDGLSIPKSPVSVDPDFLKKRWLRRIPLKDPQAIGISSIQLTDIEGKAKVLFNTNELLKVGIEIEGQVQDHYFIWVGIYRADDIYCHGITKELTRDEKILSFVYPQLKLLHGEYYISVGIWQKNQWKPVFYKQKASVFKMSFLGEDHGTVYLEHRWEWRIP